VTYGQVGMSTDVTDMLMPLVFNVLLSRTSLINLSLTFGLALSLYSLNEPC